MSPQNATGDRPASQPPMQKISAATKQQDQDEGSGNGRQSQVVVVSALAYPPAGRRTLWLLVVHSCPFCVARGPHVHRGPLAGGIRRAGCGRGRYRLQSAAGQSAVAA